MIVRPLPLSNYMLLGVLAVEVETFFTLIPLSRVEPSFDKQLYIVVELARRKGLGVQL
jgi:hypothetical protein